MSATVRPYAVCSVCFEPYPEGTPCPSCLGVRRRDHDPVMPEPPASRRFPLSTLGAVGLGLAAFCAIVVGYLAAG